jgi:hypothetical protein
MNFRETPGKIGRVGMSVFTGIQTLLNSEYDTQIMTVRLPLADENFSPLITSVGSALFFTHLPSNH